MYGNRSVSQSSEVDDFAASVAGSLEHAWGNAVAAPTGDLAIVRELGVDQGWYDLGEAGALDALVAAVRELGMRSCPLPLADAFVAARALSPGTAAAVAAGDVRPVLVVGDPAPAGFDHLDGAGDATHVLRVATDGSAYDLFPIAGVDAQPGLAVPAWSRVAVGEVVESGSLDPSALDSWRLCLAARGLAAAGRIHDLAVEHAKVRRQFGRAIGSFGAVQQRTAQCEIELRAADGLVDEAVRSVLAGSSDADLATHLALRLASDVTSRVASGGLHTLGAIGYFEEHEASWLLRRVRADALLAAGPGASVAEALVDGGRSLPPLDLGPGAEAFRDDVRALLERHRGAGSIDAESLRAEMADAGLFALGWPEEDGGLAGSVEEQVVLHEELKHAGGPVDRAMSATMLLGHSLVRHGTEDQKAAFLPLLREGRLAFCLGYSEPDAGSDLASLRTRAVRAGDGWRIDGQKSWTTRAHTANHVWLAVRTDPDASPRHAGITIFLVPMDTPGIEVQRHVALSGEVSCTVFYDDVRVPDAARVGEVDGGWRIITDALAAERVVMGGVAATMRRQLDALLDQLRADSSALDAHGRVRLSQVAARLQAARVLVAQATRGMAGDGARTVGPVAAVLSGDLAEELADLALTLLGPRSAIGAGSPGALGGHDHEAAWRLAPMFVIGGGTNDVQRGIIARSLGLPRE